MIADGFHIKKKHKHICHEMQGLFHTVDSYEEL